MQGSGVFDSPTPCGADRRELATKGSEPATC